MSTVTKAAGVLLAAGALCGIGAGTALAATPSVAPGGQQPAATTSVTPAAKGHAGDVVFFNAMPWREGISPLDGSWSTTINPGASLLLTRQQLIEHHLDKSVQISSFTMPMLQLQVPTAGNPLGVSSCPANGTGGVGCVIHTPNVRAGEDVPTQISVWGVDPDETQPVSFDAEAPGADPAAMGNFLSDIALIQPSWISFNPADVDPISFGPGPQSQAGPALYNCGADNASIQVGGQSSHSETTNISASIAVQQQIKLFDTVNTSITATFSVGHAWTDTTTDTHTETDNIKPEWVGWLSAIPSTETVTGTVTMQGNSPVAINFANVTFSEPGRTPSNNPALNFSYVAHEVPMTPDQITNICGGGPSNHVQHVVAVNAVPQQASSTNATPGSAGQPATDDQPATPPTTASSSRPHTGPAATAH